GCDQFINFRFDATSSETTLNGTNNPAVADTINHQNMTYSIGIQGVTSLDELTEVMYLGIKSLRSVPSNAIQDADVVSIDTHHGLNISKIGDDIVFTKDDDWLSLIVYDHLIGDNPDFRESRPLTIHTGPKANQALKLNFNDMRSSAMLLDTVTVTNRDNANAAIGACDAAIEYALNEVTRSGAYRARLEFTEENLVTANENTQASESTIRDADMAKEMTEYTRSNVLAQASQSMLAQANQNASSVLSLLQ
ncbi:MAG: hypothetical protein IJT01_02205, partial [Selenomonadaceae bacterium]|nr:hypothetical protein [Selenomonadaceae bacterium]